MYVKAVWVSFVLQFLSAEVAILSILDRQSGDFHQHGIKSWEKLGADCPLLLPRPPRPPPRPLPRPRPRPLILRQRALQTSCLQMNLQAPKRTCSAASRTIRSPYP